MIFIWLGRFAAWALVLLGGLGLGIGLVGLYTMPDAAARAAWAANYLGADSFGEELDQRIMMIGAGIVLGLLAEIAHRIGKGSVDTASE